MRTKGCISIQEVARHPVLGQDAVMMNGTSQELDIIAVNVTFMTRMNTAIYVFMAVSISEQDLAAGSSKLK